MLGCHLGFSARLPEAPCRQSDRRTGTVPPARRIQFTAIFAYLYIQPGTIPRVP